MLSESFPQGGFPAAVLSDMDGLLLDTEQVAKTCFDGLVQRYGIPDGDAIFPRLIGLNQAGHQAVFTETLPDTVDPEDFDAEWKAEFLRLLDGAVPVKAGAMELLAYLHRHDIPVVVVTSTATEKARDMLSRGGLLKFCQGLVGGDQVAISKPHPEIYSKGAGLAGQPIGACLALEDSNNGVRSAHGAGAVVVQVPDLAPPADDALKMSHAVIPGLDHLYDLFDWPLD
ncbi:MAG: HAD family phosphatase [Alphaproteobacteria bacterium]|nr:HAD family phosphatase [Alphaproteobacteria bacterium]